MSRWSMADIIAAQTRMSVPTRLQAAMKAAPAPKRHSNHKTFHQGMAFDSKHECRKWQEFDLERAAGKIRAVVRQISMPIAGGRRIRLDFMIVENDGRIRWMDAKGHAEREWLLKRDLVQSLYGITIETC